MLLSGRWEVVYPRKLAGLFKGEPVYWRSSVRQGATLRQWKLKGRQVSTTPGSQADKAMEGEQEEEEERVLSPDDDWCVSVRGFGWVGGWVVR